MFELYLPAILVAACVTLIVLFYVLREVSKRDRALSGIDARLGELSREVGSHAKWRSTIVDAFVSLESYISVQQGISDELTTESGDRLNRASEALFSEKMKVMKLIHHSGLLNSDEEIALRSSWALATQFGDHESLQMMIELEAERKPESLAKFQSHRLVLERRLSSNTSS